MFFLSLDDTDEVDEADDALPRNRHAMDAFEDDEDEDEADDALPTFQDDECPPDLGLDLCVKVIFPNGMEDMLLLARDSPNSTVYEGFLAAEDDAYVVLIDAPEDDERIVSLSTLLRGF